MYHDAVLHGSATVEQNNAASMECAVCGVVLTPRGKEYCSAHAALGGSHCEPSSRGGDCSKSISYPEEISF